MIFPTLPDESFQTDLNETYIGLLETISLEKNALANLINAEADKMQAFIGQEKNFPTQPENTEILQFQESTLRLMDAILFQQRLLLEKLHIIKKLPIADMLYYFEREQQRNIEKETTEKTNKKFSQFIEDMQKFIDNYNANNKFDES